MIVRLEAVSRRPLNVAVFDAIEAVSACDGWVKDHRAYSSLMAVIAFEMPASRFEAFVAALLRAGIRADPPPLWPAGEGDVPGQLVITFADGGADIRRTIPAVG